MIAEKFGVRKAFVWSAVERFSQQAVGFVVAVVLARLLSPAEYGLVGMLTIFIAIGGVFANSGFGAALIQRKEITDDDTTSCFYFNIAAGVLLAGGLCALSPAVAAFFGEPVLGPLLCVLSLQLVFSSFSMVQNALRDRDMDFKTLAIISTAATVLSGLVGIGMALKGFGVWSLVGQTLVRALSYTVLLWLMRPWRPRGRLRWASIRSLWPFSSRLLLAGMIDQAFVNSYSVVIGKLYPPADLGLFTKARGLQDLPSRTLNAVVGRVAFPYFSRLQGDLGLLKDRLRMFMQIVSAVHFPIMMGIAATAPALIPALLTEKWSGCVPLLQVLCFAGVLYPIHAFHLRTVTALGRSDLLLRVEVIKKAMIVANLVIASQISVFAMAVGMVVTSTMSYLLNGYYTRKLAAYTFREQAADLLPPLLCAVTNGALVYAAGAVAPVPGWWPTLLWQVLVGVSLYSGLVFLLRRTVFKSALEQLAHMRRQPASVATG